MRFVVAARRVVQPYSPSSCVKLFSKARETKCVKMEYLSQVTLDYIYA